MSSGPELGIDITEVMTALCAARGQSVEELLTDMRRFDPAEAMEVFERAALPKMSFEAAVARLRSLPDLDSVDDRVFRKRARILTEFGTFLYLVSCDRLDDGHWALAGVHCFPTEECDLGRRNGFVLIDYAGDAAIIQFEIFEQILQLTAPDRIYLLHIYDILLDGNDTPCA